MRSIVALFACFYVTAASFATAQVLNGTFEELPSFKNWTIDNFYGLGTASVDATGAAKLETGNSIFGLKIYQDFVAEEDGVILSFEMRGGGDASIVGQSGAAVYQGTRLLSFQRSRYVNDVYTVQLEDGALPYRIEFLCYPDYAPGNPYPGGEMGYFAPSTMYVDNVGIANVWKGGAGGYQDPAKWSHGKVPKPTESVTFSHGEASNNVGFQGDTQSKRLTVRNHDTIFSLNDNTYDVESEVIVAGKDEAVASLKVLAGELKSGSGKVGESSEKTGKVILEGDQTTWKTVDALSVYPGSKLELRQATIDVGDDLVVAKEGELNGVGMVKVGSGRTFENAGTVELDSERMSRAKESLPLRPDVESYNASIYVDGDFTQKDTGKLKLAGLGSEHVLNAKGVHSTGLLVAGTATLAGALQVEFEDGFTPAIGDRFAAVTSKELRGEITEFDYADVQGVNDRFLGLNYRRGLRGGAPVLEVVTLEKPRRLNGSSASSNLVLIAHGWRDNANSFVQLGESFTAELAKEFNSANWEVAVMNWESLNGGAGTDDFLNIPLPGYGDPLIAANNAVNVGHSLAKWIDSQGRKFNTVHLIAHSAGSWLVDAVADAFREDGVAQQIQLTLLDAFVPPSGTLFIGDPPNGPESYVHLLGDTANFAEQYMHQRPLPLIGSVTEQILPHAINFDLTPKAPWATEFAASHAYPVQWYRSTAQFPNDQMMTAGGFGAPLSTEYGGVFPNYGDVQKGDRVILGDGAMRLQPVYDQVNPSGEFHVPTGNVIVGDDGSLRMQTGSPAIITTLGQAEREIHAIEFDFTFLDAAPGLLAVYFDSQIIFEFDSRVLTLPVGIEHSSGWIYLEEPFPPGPYALTFRLDPVAIEPAKILVENIQFITFVATVPEPNAIVMLIASFLAIALTVRRARHCSSFTERVFPNGGNEMSSSQ